MNCGPFPTLHSPVSMTAEVWHVCGMYTKSVTVVGEEEVHHPHCRGCRCEFSSRQTSTVRTYSKVEYPQWRLPGERATLVAALDDPTVARDLQGSGGLCALIALMLAVPRDRAAQRDACACLLRHRDVLAVMPLSWQVVAEALRNHALPEAFALLLFFVLSGSGSARATTAILLALSEALPETQTGACVLPLEFGALVRGAAELRLAALEGPDVSEVTPEGPDGGGAAPEVLVFGLVLHLQAHQDIGPADRDASVAIAHRFVTAPGARAQLSWQCARLYALAGQSGALPPALLPHVRWLATEHAETLPLPDRPRLIATAARIVQQQYARLWWTDCMRVGEVAVEFSRLPRLACTAAHPLLDLYGDLALQTQAFAEVAVDFAERHALHAQCQPGKVFCVLRVVCGVVWCPMRLVWFVVWGLPSLMFYACEAP